MDIFSEGDETVAETLLRKLPMSVQSVGTGRASSLRNGDNRVWRSVLSLDLRTAEHMLKQYLKW